VSKLSVLDEETLQEELGRLVQAELVYQRGIRRHATYSFKHALIQDVAYASLLRSARQQNHRHIAQVLEAQFPDTAETQPEVLAHHLTEAGLHENAIDYWYRAGQHAMERSANTEAIHHLHKRLMLLETLPETRMQLQYAFTPDDLGEVIAAWEHIPAAVRAGIVAMVRASRQA